MNINRKEIYRYLGYKGQTPDEKTQKEIDSVIQEVEDLSDPRCSIKYETLTLDVENFICRIGTMEIKSRDLSKNLEGCSKVCLLCATIGMEIDRMIRKYEIIKMSRAAIFQAVSAAYVEAYVNDLNDMINEKAESEGYITKTRYSPGYGDFSLEHQGEFLRLVDANRKAGITLTDGNLMIPSKSVTAVIGFKKADD